MVMVQKPVGIIDYNHKMGGVDLVSQKLDSLNVPKKIIHIV